LDSLFTLAKLVFKRGNPQGKPMTAADVIEQIEKLPHGERAKVIEFAQSSWKQKKLSPEEIGNLCDRMQNAKSAAEADRLEQQIIEGFYAQG
jgi:hypothetical protein